MAPSKYSSIPHNRDDVTTPGFHDVLSVVVGYCGPTVVDGLVRLEVGVNVVLRPKIHSVPYGDCKWAILTYVDLSFLVR